MVQKVKQTTEHAYKKYKLAIKKTYKEDNTNVVKSKKTTYNKRLASKIVADWEPKVVVPGTEPIWIDLTPESRECRQWTGENNTLKNFLSMSSITSITLDTAYTRALFCTSDSFSRFLAPYKFVCMYMYVSISV